MSEHYREFCSQSDAKKWGHNTSKAWIQALSAKVRKILKKYRRSNQYCEKINMYLRTSESPLEHPNEEVILLHSALSKSVLQENIVVIRNSYIPFLRANGKDIGTVCCGDILEEKGFMSVSLFKSAHAKSKRGITRVRLVIEVPAGTCAAYINPISHMWTHEAEMLLDLGCKLRVEEVIERDVSGAKKDWLLLRLRVISQPSAKFIHTCVAPS